ncbi:MAG: hypothetical protein GY913_34455 [Proteobacteria bacterium]|nr:hypothetical protein [Pseudomonadota bacterium]MCP4922032.1 hypothetical protein [Pseudomonadota bacterium]
MPWILLLLAAADGELPWDKPEGPLPAVWSCGLQGHLMSLYELNQAVGSNRGIWYCASRHDITELRVTVAPEPYIRKTTWRGQRCLDRLHGWPIDGPEQTEVRTIDLVLDLQEQTGTAELVPAYLMR